MQKTEQNTGKYIPVDEEFSQIYTDVMQETDDMSNQHIQRIVLMQQGKESDV